MSKQRIERALVQADGSLEEARQLITNMRIPALENNTLPTALKATIMQMVAGLGIDFHFAVKGYVCQGPYDLEANLFLIAREAVTNTLNHASAKKIRVELTYSEKQVILQVQDNGKGFDPEVAISKAGHWGLRGMQERSRQVKGVFNLQSAEGMGSTISVAVPLKR